MNSRVTINVHVKLLLLRVGGSVCVCDYLPEAELLLRRRDRQRTGQVDVKIVVGMRIFLSPGPNSNHHYSSTLGDRRYIVISNYVDNVDLLFIPYSSLTVATCDSRYCYTTDAPRWTINLLHKRINHVEIATDATRLDFHSRHSLLIRH